MSVLPTLGPIPSMPKADQQRPHTEKVYLIKYPTAMGAKPKKDLETYRRAEKGPHAWNISEAVRR